MKQLQGEVYITAKMNKFKVDPLDSDYPERYVCFRKFSGRMTRGRWKLLSRFCRSLTYRRRCNHDYDCCGCMFMQQAFLSYKHNQVTITIVQNFNY